MDDKRIIPITEERVCSLELTNDHLVLDADCRGRESCCNQSYAYTDSRLPGIATLGVYLLFAALKYLSNNEISR